MKKIITLIFILSIFSVAFAGNEVDDGVLTLGAIETETVQMSNNVQADYDGSKGSYAATTYNPNGRGKNYLVTSESGATYVNDNATELVAPTSSPDSNTWTKL